MANYSRQNDYKIIKTDISPTFLAATAKKKKESTRDTKDFYPGFLYKNTAKNKQKIRLIIPI